MSKTTQIRVDPETADYLSTLADDASVPRPTFVRLLAHRFGEELSRDLKAPVRPRLEGES